MILLLSHSALSYLELDACCNLTSSSAGPPLLDISAASCAHVPIHANVDWIPTFDAHELPDPLADLKSDTVVYAPINPSTPSIENPADISLGPAQARFLSFFFDSTTTWLRV